MTPLEQSERILAEILVVLAGRGLRRVALRLDDLDGGRYPPELFCDACDWLRDEGFLRTRVVRAHPPVAEEAVLTARGFAIFGRTITIGGERVRLGDAIQSLAGAPPPRPEDRDPARGILGSLAELLAD